MKRFLFWLENPKRWYLITAVVAVLGAGWTWLSAVPAAETTGGQIPSPREGFLAPDFTLATLGGESLTLSDFRGGPVIVNLWASWCPPCRAEMPAIQRIYEENRDRGLIVLAVNTTYQDSEGAAAAFLQEFDFTFPVLLDRQGTVSRQYQLRALPTTFFIDAQGVVQKVIIGGPMSTTTLATGVADLFAEKR
jgi:thiol-disulfide isomerase/thioredoxin